MMSDAKERNFVTYGRVAGLLCMVIIVLGIFSEVFVRGGVIVPEDATQTAMNILASEALFRVGIVSDVIVFLSDVAVAVLLYVLLRPVSQVLSLMAAGFRLTGTAIYGVNLLNQVASILLLSGSGHLGDLTPAQLDAMASFFLDLHGHGYDLGLVFFGVHCLMLGYLLFRSNLFPAPLGVLMALAGGGYLIGSFTLFLFPAYSEMVAPVYVAPLVGELAFCIWLMVRGVRTAS